VSGQTDPQGDKPTAPMRDAGRGGTALLIIDMIADFAAEERAEFADCAERAAANIVRLRDRADAFDIPIIYVNDHFGEWHSDRSKLVDKAKANRAGALGAIAPRPRDYFIIKPQFSGFYATNLPVLLPKLGVGRLVLTGVSTDMCILCTAADAHMRDYALWVPEDATAAASQSRKAVVLAIMREGCHAETRASRTFDLLDDFPAIGRKP
jgi:nicotinamidase-related amidase